MEKDAGRLETIADVGSAADFVRVAKDSGETRGFSGQDQFVYRDDTHAFSSGVCGHPQRLCF